MLTVTEAARTHLAQLLEQEGLPEEVAIRFVAEEQGLAMQPDSQRDGDTAFEHEGRIVLLLDEELAQSLANHTLDAEGAELSLRAVQDEA